MAGQRVRDLELQMEKLRLGAQRLGVKHRLSRDFRSQPCVHFLLHQE